MIYRIQKDEKCLIFKYFAEENNENSIWWHRVSELNSISIKSAIKKYERILHRRKPEPYTV